MEQKGLVFGIQHFSIHDGDGIRSNVFLKGCPLRCLWCHNPEGLSAQIGIQYIQNKCRGCGRCGYIFKNMHDLYIKSEEEKQAYAAQCVYGALEPVGKWMTVTEVIDDVMKDLCFFKESNGGITVSGGEPMLQHEYTLALLKEAKKRGIQTAMETSGFASLKQYKQVLPYVDEFLWDYKETDETKHKKFTGVSNQRILENLDALYKDGANIILRCPIIPGLNDTEEHFRGIAKRSRQMKNLKGVELMPYHKFGVAKDARIGRMEQKEYEIPSKDMKKSWEEQIIAMGGRLF
mgnify:FL=1